MTWFWRIFSISCFVLGAFVTPAYCELATVLLVSSIIASLAAGGAGVYGAYQAGEAAEEQMEYQRGLTTEQIKEGKRLTGIKSGQWKAEMKQRILEAARQWELAQEQSGMQKEAQAEGMQAARMGRYQAGRQFGAQTRTVNLQLADALNRSKARRAIRKVKFGTAPQTQSPLYG